MGGAWFRRSERCIWTYTTGDRPLAPPQPIIIIAKVIVEITKLQGVSRLVGCGS